MLEKLILLFAGAISISFIDCKTSFSLSAISLSELHNSIILNSVDAKETYGYFCSQIFQIFQRFFNLPPHPSEKETMAMRRRKWQEREGQKYYRNVSETVREIIV